MFCGDDIDQLVIARQFRHIRLSQELGDAVADFSPGTYQICSEQRRTNQWEGCGVRLELDLNNCCKKDISDLFICAEIFTECVKELYDSAGATIRKTSDEVCEDMDIIRTRWQS